jgi:phage major capsid protein, HK97 family|nr:MAG TPA: major capsid protein [Caudoviricetes sp.]
MLTSSDYNYEFGNAIRNKRKNETTLSEGYDKSSGSYMFPSGGFNDFSDAVVKENLFRRLGTVLHTPTKEGLIQTVFSTANAAIVDEATAFPEDNDSFDKASFSSYKVAAVSKLNNRFIEDMHFNIEKYLTNEFARRFGRSEEQFFINGTGVNEPTGLLITAETGHYIDTSDSLSYDDIISLFFAAKPEFRKNSVWLMNDNTALILRTLKDINGNYLWRLSDDTILGKPVIISPYMPDIAANSIPVAFGDLSYFWILERQALSVKILTELYARENQTGYAAYERIDGKLIRPEAVQLLKVK